MIAQEKSALLTVDDLALLLKISRDTVDRMRAAGETPVPFRVGRSLRWQRAAIEWWLANPKPNGDLMSSKEFTARYKGGK